MKTCVVCLGAVLTSLMVGCSLVNEWLNSSRDGRYDANTVTSQGTNGGGTEHMYSFDYAYQLEPVRDGLFEPSK